MPGLSRPPPMALTFSLTNITKFLSYMAPFLISFFMIMFSILTGSIVKGLLFISGLLIVTFMNYLLKNSLKSLQDPLASPFCNSLPAPFTLRAGEHIFNSPSTSSTIIAFTLAYLAYPMILKPINMNPVLIAFLVALIGINGAVEVQDRCTNVSGIFLGSLVGILFGIIFFSLVKMSGNESLAFFTEQGSNGIQCSKPGKTNFKCVKKHGPSLRDISEETSSNGQSSSSGILTTFQQKATDTFMYINSDTYTKGTSLVEENKIPLGTKCPSSKDDLQGGTICDLGGYCSNNNCVACRTVNDCYKRNYSGGFNSPYNSWNINALKCGVFERNSKSWQVKIYKCGTGDVSILTNIKRAWRGRDDGAVLEEEGGYGIDYPANHEVKQCIPNTIAISEYRRNRGSSSPESPSIDGILYIQKNIVPNQNELKLTLDEAQELVDYFTIYYNTTKVGNVNPRKLRDQLIKIQHLKKLEILPIPKTHEDLSGVDGDSWTGGLEFYNEYGKQIAIKERLRKYTNSGYSHFNNDGLKILNWDNRTVSKFMYKLYILFDRYNTKNITKFTAPDGAWLGHKGKIETDINVDTYFSENSHNASYTEWQAGGPFN